MKRVKNHSKRSLPYVLILFYLSGVLLAGTGCVSTGGTAMQSHKKGLEGITDNEYFVTKKPIDRHYIGCAWSKQFGPVEDPAADDIRIKKEKSFSGVQQDFAYNLGFALGGQSIAGPQAEAGIQGGSIEKAKMEGIEIIAPVSIADITFEPNIPYVTEALRLSHFKIKEEKSNKAGVNVSAGTVLGSGSAIAEAGSEGRRGTEGDGLVVAYKLHSIDQATYQKNDSGPLPFQIDKSIDFPKANIVVKARLQLIEPGSSKSLPRNLLWACPKAEAKSRDMLAAWIIDLKSTDPKKKSLSIAFPAFPRIDECQNYGGVIFSKIDPVTDRIIRQKINIAVIDDEVSDNLKQKKWDARISLIDESFKIKLIKPADLEEASKQ